MISVVIPAHNEQNVIRRCLLSLAHLDRHNVVVSCNGCRDDTAGAARSAGSNVYVIETDVASKSNALNLGDAAATGFPRFYIDADVVLDHNAIQLVAEALRSPDILAVAPLMRVDCSNRPWTVRAYYNVWLRLPYCRSGMIGSGVYALSEKGRRRFDKFPDVTADDAFVRLHFKPHERKTIESCAFTITPPDSLAGIIHIKTRSHFGNEELRKRFPHLWQNEETRHARAFGRFITSPRLWPAIAVYLYVKLMIRWRVRRRQRRSGMPAWERDDSSRQVSFADAPV